MIDPVSGGTAGSMAPRPVATPSTATVPAEKPTTAVDMPKTIQGKGDTVELSLTAQIRNLKLQGQSLNQIAFALGLDTKTVASYLGEPA